MRRKVKFSVILFFVMIIGLLAYKFYGKFQEKQFILEKIKQLPEFSLYSTNGELKTNKYIERDNWVVFIFFNSECHYCQEEAIQLKDLKGGVDGVQFFWISSEPSSTIADFQELYGLTDHTSIFFLHDPNSVFAKKCNVIATPQFLVYDTSGALVKNHKGAWRIDKLLDNISNEFKAP